MNRTASISAICLATLMAGIAFADYDVRNTFGVEGSLDTLKLAFEEEVRFDDDGHHYNHFDIAMSHKVAKWLSLGAGYRQIYDLRENWQLENCPSMVANLSQKLNSLSLKDKNKLEIRFRDGKDTTWRYRSKFSLAPSLRMTSLKLYPYLTDEIFVDEDGLGRNRFSLGLAMAPAANLKCELFGMIQSDNKDDAWDNTSVLGTKVKAAF